ncbi:uncharacterized protein THITE_2109416 [Thermothielavioides terrestris NRRL 8126]|uniref:Uncharacterized protein n=1 Tax=Thermothielavioides terrestris (strain ATCC 38088 / NRRL 8126) TaxID=578455 RepID=G2QVD3_THETT|nr:uncharacterized protein THITE_2109416 [Thermothielavioides terrestris NRRL 8126]AEO63820.1 hypothetical protein THITE_2109416 [Thermothielavioides terrestris NRRL 8126]
MDGLRVLSESVFAKQAFSSPSPRRELHVFEIPHSGPARRGTVLEPELGIWANPNHGTAATRTPESPAVACLRLVCVHRELDVTLGVSELAFRKLMESMRVDKGALSMISRDYDGFHMFGQGSSNKGHGVMDASSALPTWFVGTSLYAILWTFNPETSHSLGVFFNRSRNTFASFTDTLETFAAYIHSPHLLCFNVCVHQLHTYDDDSNRFSLKTIRDIEKQTGYYPNAAALDDPDLEPRRWATTEFEIGQLSDWARRVGIVTRDAASKTRHQATYRAIVTEVRKAGAIARKAASRRPAKGLAWPDSRQMMREESALALSEAVPVIEKQLATYAEYLDFLRYRAERLSDVVSFPLL